LQRRYYIRDMEYRRSHIKGGRFFFTVVTYKREKLFNTAKNIELLRESIRDVKQRHPFTIDAFVLLPDHIHCIWTLPQDDHDFSTRWRLLKSFFSRHCEHRHHELKPSQISKKEQAIWQPRYWEHFIRDERDFISHVEYIHYNPVKHGLVQAPKDWEYSSFHRYVEKGVYGREWGAYTSIQLPSNIGME
jgi:putative transposase